MLIPILGHALRFALAGAVVTVATLSPAWSQDTDKNQEPTALVTAANASLGNFMRDPEMKWFQQNIGRAKGVLIAPEVGKVGFIVGGSGGRAVLVMKNPKGKWTGPAFYTLATGSVGLQAGVSVSEMVTLVMTDKGINSLLSNSFKMGADASVAAGPVGAGAGSDVVADLITFSRAKGVYGGVNLDGTVVKVNSDWNAAFYNAPGVQPTDILIRGKVSNRNSVALLNTVTKAAAGK